MTLEPDFLYQDHVEGNTFVRPPKTTREGAELRWHYFGPPKRVPVHGDRPIDPTALRQIDSLRKDVLYLKAEYELLKDEQEKLKLALASIGVGESLIERSVEDPLDVWCINHQNELSRMPEQYLAVDISSGQIVASAVTEVEFSKQLKDLPEEIGNRVHTIHTSIFHT